MSRSRRAALALSAAAVALLGPLAAPSGAAATSCEAVADVPHLVPNGSGIYANGVFACANPSALLTVEVCIEEQYVTLGGWHQLGCATTQAANASAVVGAVRIDVLVYSTLLRTTVHGTTAEGASASATGAPVLWFNCACML
jgi:hypothetical protein